MQFCSIVAVNNAIKNTSKKPDGSLYSPDDWNTESTLESNAYNYSKTQVSFCAHSSLSPGLILKAVIKEQETCWFIESVLQQSAKSFCCTGGEGGMGAGRGAEV